ncbi:Ig-like domain-containing protein [Microbacterium sp. 1P10UB]|uniref:Ig-like domain-containing protein n=1 Tax=unclassified Microbacterium TaxID=2609290 RepID=UPI0039A1BC7B
MRRRSLVGWSAAGVAAALVIGVSVVWPGLDARETPEVDTSVWALQTGEGRRYARVNTAIGELDTVRTADSPSQILAAGDDAYLLSDSSSRITRIDPALPIDLTEDALSASPQTPPGTTEVAGAGDFVAYRTDAGEVYAGRLSRGDTGKVNPFPGQADDAPQYSADAIAVDDRGILFAYSSREKAVLRYDIGSSTVLGSDPLDADIAGPAVTAAGEDWAVVDTESGSVRLRGVADAVQTGLTNPVVGEAATAGSAIYLADETRLLAVPVDGASPRVEHEVASPGTPAEPVVRDGDVLAAWLPQGSGAGTLWRSGQTAEPLDYAGKEIGEQRRPVFVQTRDAVILNETRSGWVWTVPDGRLVSSSQNWSLDDEAEQATVPSQEEVSVVVDPKPPVAEPDAFGVRPGALVSLPVLLNDHDPNLDVLSIDPESVTGLDPGFGTVSLTDDDQRLAVRVSPTASGAATFRYAVTDGTTSTGLPSDPATVTLTVVGADASSPPQWCGVKDCRAPWPTPQVARNGTVTVPVLPGWVDPEGDPMFLLSVANESGVGSVAATPDGQVVYQHRDDGDSDAQNIELTVTVSDTTGEQATKTLVVAVSGEPKIAVQSFAVLDTVGASLTVDVAPHVTGTAGQLSLSNVRMLDDSAATATVVGGSTTFDFASRDPGTFQVGFSVTDGNTEASGTARITLLPADASAELSTAPVVAFVRPQEDATLDVFAAVSNPTRRVLLLSDAVARADDGATMAVDVVGQNDLRVSGSTASGAPGRLGTVTYTVSDGTDDDGASVEGTASVYLLPPAPALAPIAVDDSVVVRAGAQIDIPVLDNDVAPAGGRPQLDPGTVVSSSTAALAFASGDALRYLAPTEPGLYSVEYVVSTPGSPALTDRARVRVTVLADDANRAPLPETLEGRVRAGQSTEIAFDAFGVDPDGDAVRLDRIVSQPDVGAATISADGESIVYTSVAGRPGQFSFRYRVVDAFGRTGDATARVGVLDAESDPSPVTFSDYVQVQAGEGNSIRVSPLANDLDPTGGRLEITGVRPDLPQTLEDGSESPLYAAQADRIRSRSSTTVTFEAGAEPTTMSFLYDVESASGNTGRGLIVVRVVRESVPDYPVVADTVLTVEDRDSFVDGVDVLTGRVAWSGGDTAALTVGLWGDQGDVAVSGRRVSGPLPADSRVIPISVTGEGRDGPVTTYAFLRVPGESDGALTLRTGLPDIRVTETESVAFDMASLVAVPRGRTLEVGAEVRASGARAEATCVPDGGTSVRYASGSQSPWVDACQVPVRLDGQDEFTYVSVPITVVPLDPQPELRPASITVGPGETATYDLREMTRWQLREDWESIRYAAEYAGTQFTVALEGSVLTVTGSDRAVPGTEEAVIVTAPSHPAVASARLLLRVGASPSTLPAGGSTTAQCSEAAGSSCVIPVVGVPGELNPLPGTPLEVTGVRATGACDGVAFEVASATEVRATWTADTAGMTCPATFSVRDAQGRATNSERDGQLLLDLQGFPRAPAALTQTAFADGGVTMQVDPGEASAAYPALAGFSLRYQGTEVASCTPDGVCPLVAAPNSEPRVYEAFAVNAVGTSATSVRATGWAYDVPAAPAGITTAPVVTRGDGGVVSIDIAQVDPDTGSLEISSPVGDTVRVDVAPGQVSVQIPSFRVGANTGTQITLTPYSRYEPPPGLGGRPFGASATVVGSGVGAPLAPTLALSAASDGDGTSTVTATATATANGDGSDLRFGIVRDGQSCTTTAGGQRATFSGLPDGEEYTFVMCAESRVGGRVFGTTSTSATVRAVQSAAAPRGWTFTVDGAPDVGDGSARWYVRDSPSSPEQPPRNNDAVITGFPSTVFDRDPGFTVQYRHRDWGTVSEAAALVPASGSAPYQVRASWGVESCVGGSALVFTRDSSRAPDGTTADIAFDTRNAVYLAADGTVVPERVAGIVPVGTSTIEGIAVTVDWSKQGWDLDAATATISARCQPNLPPAP